MLDYFRWLRDTTLTSGTIIWQRLQYPLAAAYFAAAAFDVSPFLKDPRAIFVWVVGNAFISELIRRHRAEYDEDGKMK